ncbi:hypothetical protein GGH12_000018 [Coemansia sp. RSA 1822]|nr:hypothetical protein LPJ76_001036 [Coemansia sp. RSA 638]KAJ2545497.1 hypothetical protein GGF49_000304 [Coemansia sp. RSA 1853]KAJ2567887.1 hypothetical protein GGH12_000018 [Coemansia sp. RSA 1822]
MAIVADSGTQPGLSMIALGLLAGVAGLWVYSATQDQSTSHLRQPRRSSTSSTHSDGAVRTTLHRTRTIRRSRRQMSSDSIAEEIRDTDFGLDTTGSADQAASATVGARTVHDVLDTGHESDASESEENGTDADMRLLQLLCTISEDQSRRNGIIHRGTTCNSCQETPIRGIRYKCAQCATVDICEACEANDVHRHHVMLRISVPLPPLMNPRMPLIRKIYPGTLQPKELPRDVRKELEGSTCLDRIDIISLYNEFCVLASNIDGVEAITRSAFYKCLGQFGGADSVIASRLFAYYDEDGDDRITFPEMARGFSVYNKGTPEEKAPGVFRAYDVDGDNMLSRDDLRIMLEAFADASREITKNMVRALEDDVLEVPSRLLPGQPISAAFTAPIPTHSPSALDKEVSALRAEVHALRESAAVRRSALMPDEQEGEDSSDAGSSGSGAATTSATVGTIASLRMPRRLSANVTISNDGSGPIASDTAQPIAASDSAEHSTQAVEPATNTQNNNNVAAVAAFTDTIKGNNKLNPPTSVDLLAASSDPRNTLHVSTAWHDAAEDDDWSVMEALSQDTIRLMIDEIFTEAAPRDPICMTYSEFFDYLQRNSSLAMYFEVLGTIF